MLFSNVIILHVLFSILLVGLLEIIEPFIFHGFLNIETSRILSAKIVYQCSVFMVIMSFMSAPFLALLISHENIVYSSIVQIVDSFLRLGVALAITVFGDDKLTIYVLLLCAISIFKFLSYVVYTHLKYEECTRPRFRHLNKSVIKSISGFLVWQLYSTGCIVGRTQGTAIILNKLFGTFINTAFGIAQQVSGAISFVSSSLINAINPQIIKAEGAGDRSRMFELSMTASKFGFFLLSIVVMPLVFNMGTVLNLWLGNVPPYAILFCQVILITSLCDQTTLGLGTANQAIGNVKNYSLTVNTLKIITVPLIAISLLLGLKLEYSIWIYAIMELGCALFRIIFLHYSGGLDIRLFFQRVFVALCIPFLFLIISYYTLHNSNISLLAIVLVTFGISLIYIFLFFKFSLTSPEKKLSVRIISKISKKIIPTKFT